ncbi:Uu.00g029240.m01.CDS01 [Anthostomella pinea]|uniref:Uu.00g029240.m01.CDS01 n=1 Tax=Anthostomella pinea TaxID=933095 RepID=A0AAI8YCS6_9PEZI|nr:Uu.00g029240.m01.CDS01 [Anthostomella pinea]
MFARLYAPMIMALAAFSITAASPVTPRFNYGLNYNFAEEANVTLLEKRATFQYRFYDNNGCDHNSNPGDTWPSNGGQGAPNNCYSAPTGINWNRVEIDVFFSNGGSLGLQTFCNVNCAGGVSIKQQGTNCYLPIAG